MSRPVLLVGHGSLMSARGLGEALAATLDARLLWIEGAPRGFHKPVQRGGCLAMDVALTAAAARGRTCRPAAPSPAVAGELGFEGVLLSVEGEATALVARREGYPPDAWERLRLLAGEAGIEALLLRLAEEEAGGDALAYRRALRALAGKGERFADTCHYLPHPVVTDRGPAVIFVAPGPDATGDERPSCRAPYPALERTLLDRVFEHGPAAYARFDGERQRHYAEVCLLAAAHGVHVGDLLGGALAADHPLASLLAGWRADPSPLAAERSALRQIPALATGAAYAARFPASLDAALARSGLAG